MEFKKDDENYIYKIISKNIKNIENWSVGLKNN